MPHGLRSLHLGPKIGIGVGGASESTGLNIIAFFGQSNTNGFGGALVANQTHQPNICFAYPAVQMLDHLATINGDPLVWTFNRPSGIPSDGSLAVLTPVSLSPRTGDANGDFSADLSMMRALDRALPGKWALAKMGIPSSSMLNWIAIGSTYPTLTPHLIDQLMTFLAQSVSTLGGRIAACVLQQGESDAQTGPLSTAWQGRATDVIATVRAVHGNVPFYLPKMHTGTGGTGLATIIAAQAALASTLSQVYVIDTSLIPGGSPGALHYTPDQYADAGPIYADRILGVMGINQPPYANFSWSWTATAVTFADSSTDRDGTIASWLWDFGDGTTSTSQNPVKVYGALGTYSVRLTVTDNGGATNSVTRQVTCAAGNWDVDALAGIGLPSTPTQWAAAWTAAGLTGVAPDEAWLFGGPASGTIPGVFGLFPLDTVTNTPTYQFPVPNWTAKALRTINNTTDGVNTTNVLLPDTLTESVTLGALMVSYAIPTGTRGIMGMGTTECALTINNSNPPKLITRSNTQTTTSTATVDNLAHFHVVEHNRTASSCFTVTDLQASFTTAFAPSVTGKRIRFGLTGSQAVSGLFIMGFMCRGANAEKTAAQWKALGAVLGFVMP